ncbi:MAG: SCO family protein [Dehalococcoidia bacterium]|nr:SCO family protein [Dehalococcoidia bacterium]
MSVTSKTSSNSNLSIPSWRIFAVMATLVALVFLIGTLVLFNLQQASEARGFRLDEPKQMPAFTLTNQFGDTVSSDEYKGKVVVMTFLFTSCVDACPLTAAKLRDTYELVRDKSDNVAFVAISVDPDRDTPNRMKEFSDRWDMTDKWDFLTGNEAFLQPLWKEFWAGPIKGDAKSFDSTTGGNSAGAADAIYEVQHAAPVHLTDKEGRVRIVYGNAIEPLDIAHDILLLLG